MFCGSSHKMYDCRTAKWYITLYINFNWLDILIRICLDLSITIIWQCDDLIRQYELFPCATQSKLSFDPNELNAQTINMIIRNTFTKLDERGFRSVYSEFWSLLRCSLSFCWFISTDFRTIFWLTTIAIKLHFFA